MRLKFLLDMNLSPNFAEYLRLNGCEACHWVSIGDPEATDAEIMQYAASQGFTVLTLDLDFSAILAATQGSKPSVVQIRTKEAVTEKVFAAVLANIIRAENELLGGAILSIDLERSRLRMLPILPA